jgi:hypothetical protein
VATVSSLVGPGPGSLIGRRAQGNQICAHRRLQRQSQVAAPNGGYTRLKVKVFTLSAGLAIPASIGRSVSQLA